MVNIQTFTPIDEAASAQKLSDRRRALVMGAVLSACGISSSRAQVNAYPNQLIKWVVGFPAGGGVDFVSRLMANQMSGLLKQPIVIDNRVGAGGTIASNYVAKAPADGYTFHTMDVCGFTSVQHLYSNLPYNPPKDIQIVSLLVRQPFVLVVNANSPARTYQELVALAKKDPGKLNYGSSGVGTPLHIGMEMFQVRAGIKLTHVPYKAMVSMVTDLVGGQVEVALGDYGSLKPFIQNGKLRALAVAMDSRIAGLADTPTFDELGVKNLPVSVWLSLATPAGTPAPVVEKLAAVAKEAVLSPSVRDKLANVGIEPFVISGKDAATFLANQLALWADALKPLNIRID